MSSDENNEQVTFWGVIGSLTVLLVIFFVVSLVVGTIVVAICLNPFLKAALIIGAMSTIGLGLLIGLIFWVDKFFTLIQ